MGKIINFNTKNKFNMTAETREGRKMYFDTNENIFIFFDNEEEWVSTEYFNKDLTARIPIRRMDIMKIYLNDILFWSRD